MLLENKPKNDVYIGRNRRKIKGKEYICYMVSVLFIITGTLLYIWPNVKILNVNYEFFKLKNEKNKLFQRNRLLRIELESLNSFYRVEQEAVKKGFTIPQNGQIVYVLTD